MCDLVLISCEEGGVTGCCGDVSVGGGVAGGAMACAEFEPLPIEKEKEKWDYNYLISQNLKYI